MLKPRRLLAIGAGVFALLTFGLSAWRWATFQYSTFDLAFYVQALWLTLHGHSTTTVLGVSLLGNHAEPIVYLALPLFALCPHPLLLPALQIAALASMPFTARRIGLRLGLSERPATALALATLLMPASGYVAIHEFHAEALAAPLLLLLYEARQRRRWNAYACWFLLTLAVKENIALLLIAWHVVFAWLERSGPVESAHLASGRAETSDALPGLIEASLTVPSPASAGSPADPGSTTPATAPAGFLTPTQWRWKLAPALLAAVWFLAYTRGLAPWLNGGHVDYGNLYSGITDMPSAAASLWRGLTQGNLAGLMLLSSAGLVLLRPRWIVIALPVLLQHLLSWRSSEWTVWFHYAAPLVPLAWLGTAEACARRPRWLACVPVAVCLLLQPFYGPVRELAAEWRIHRLVEWNRQWKTSLLGSTFQRSGENDSLVCGMGYLAHFATRERLYPLHLVLKGTQTLSQARYRPDFQPDYAILDFSESATFNKSGGYYHPEGLLDGERFPSSDELLLRLFAGRSYDSTSMNELTVLSPTSLPLLPPRGFDVSEDSLRGARLHGASSAQPPGRLALLELDWEVPRQRPVIPWMKIALQSPAGNFTVPLGMAVPWRSGGPAHEKRVVSIPPWVPAGTYAAQLVWYDQIRVLWGKSDRDPVLGVAPLGNLTIQ